MADYTLSAKVTGDSSGFQRAFQSATRTLEELSNKTKNVSKKISELGKNISDFGDTLTSKITKPAVAATSALTGLALVKGFNRLVGIDTAQAKLKALGHDAKNVESIMDSALQSVRGTAFGLDEAATTAANAVAAGIPPGKELTRYLSITADAAAIAGSSMGELGSILNKVTTAGRAYNGELQMLADRGLPIYQWLAKEAGVTADAIFDMASDGAISSEMLLNAIEKNIGGAAKIMGEESFSAAVANIGADISRIGANFLDAGGKAGGFFSTVKPLLTEFRGYLAKVEEKAADWGVAFGRAFNNFIDGAKELKARFNELSPSVQNFILKSAGIGAAVIVGLGPALKLIGLMTSGFSRLMMVVSFLVSPIGLVITAITALGALFGRQMAINEKFRATVIEVFNNVKNAIISAIQVVIPFLQRAGTIIKDTFLTLGPYIEKVFTVISAVVKSAAPIIVSVFKRIAGIVIPLVKNLGNAIGEIASTVIPVLFSVLKTLIPVVLQVGLAFSNIINMVLPVLISLINQLLPIITQIVGIIAEIATQLMPLVNVLIGSLLPVITSIVTVVMNIVQAVAPAVIAIIQVIMQIIQALLPIIMSIITVVVEVVSSVIATISPIVAFIGGIISSIMAIISPIVTFVSGIISSIVGVIRPIISFVTGIFTTVFSIVSGIFRNIVTFVGSAINGISTFISGLTSVVSGVFNAIFGTVSRIMDNVSGKVTGVFSTIRGAWSGLTGFVSGVFGGISGSVQKLVEQVKKFVNKVIGGINAAISIINKIPGVEIGKIPYLARGTDDWYGGFAYINEGGRGELVHLPDGAQVIPHDVSMRYAREAAKQHAHQDQRGTGFDINVFERFLQALENSKRPVIIVEGDAEWIRAYVNEQNAVDDTFRHF